MLTTTPRLRYTGSFHYKFICDCNVFSPENSLRLTWEYLSSVQSFCLLSFVTDCRSNRLTYTFTGQYSVKTINNVQCFAHQIYPQWLNIKLFIIYELNQNNQYLAILAPEKMFLSHNRNLHVEGGYNRPSDSPWSSLGLAPKGENGCRLCGDYRGLNSHNIPVMVTEFYI